LGVQRSAKGHLFTIFAPQAKQVELAIDLSAQRSPFTELFALERCAGAGEEKGCWQGELRGLPEAFEYVYRLDGGPELFDPYARCLTGGEVWGDRSWESRGLPYRPYRGYFSSELAAPSRGGRPPRPQLAEAERVIYELHLRGFTRHSSSGVEHPGTYLGLIEKIPYLQSLGVTTVELLPLMEFDETENRRRNPRTGEALVNFWGYSPVSFFAPKASYASERAPGAAQRELMTMVDALHEAGLEVIVDVVYNHTAEGGGGATDPLHSFRALADAVYYIHDPATGRPLDVTGCGNSVNTNHPVVKRLILDSLRHWTEVIGIDGFRFDLAAIFYRGLAGEKLALSPVAAAISADPQLAGRLLIAEPWDVTGFTPPAGFPYPWREWNGAFRDDLRRYLRGDAVASRRLELRLAGSPDLFPPPHTSSSAVDFVTCHDGFPLADLFAYESKHNLENGEGDRDGSTFNLSSNGGIEGPTQDPAVLALRRRQTANALALLLLTRGTPMLLAGDELGRSQGGNNNAWCQDNEISWIDWTAAEGGLKQLVSRLIDLRRELSALDFSEWTEAAPFHPAGAPPSAEGSVKGAGRGLGAEDGAGPVALLTRPQAGGRALLLALNPTERVARFPVPRVPGGGPWKLALDTHVVVSTGMPQASERPALAAETSELEVQPGSLRVLIA
jgi:isoamylase